MWIAKIPFGKIEKHALVISGWTGVKGTIDDLFFNPDPNQHIVSIAWENDTVVYYKHTELDKVFCKGFPTL